MAAYKDPGFKERAALSADAKRKALEKLKAKPAIDPAVLAERTAARLAKEAAESEKRRAKQAEREAAEAAKREAAEAAARAEAEALAAAEAAKQPELTDEERKAARDAKYAARKSRKGR